MIIRKIILAVIIIYELAISFFSKFLYNSVDRSIKIILKNIKRNFDNFI